MIKRYLLHSITVFFLCIYLYVVWTFMPNPCPMDHVSTEMVYFSEGNFCLDAHEVTNAAYQKCMVCQEPSNDEYYRNPDFKDHPVIWVNWEQADTYCRQLPANKRLPTALEWDDAAENLTWPSDKEIEDFGITHSVKGFPQDKTPEGVYDLAGNVSEWVDESIGDNLRVVKGKNFLGSEPKPAQSTTPSRERGFRCAADP